MSSVFGLGLRIAGYGLLLVAQAGCSFASMRLPPDDPAERARTPAKCKSIYPPLADSTWAIGGLLDVMYANNQLDGDVIGTRPDGSEIRTEPGSGDRRAFQILRGVGYGAMLVLGTSAIYGFYVHANCPTLEHRLAREKREAKSLPARVGFPASVYAFQFGMSAADAGLACSKGGQAWQFENSVGSCTARSAATTLPDVRVSYRFGVIHEITAIYHALPARLNKNYDQLYTSLRERYGKPQVERARLSGDCATSLAQCLEDGQRPTGVVWHWPSGSVELVPTVADGRACLELRHVREEPLTQ